MFIRVTVVEYDPVHTSEVERLWQEESQPLSRAQKGNLGTRAFRSVNTPGQLIIIAEWESIEQADAYMRTPEHVALTKKYGPYLRGTLKRFFGQMVGSPISLSPNN